jgi:hypothetical protein
MSDADRFAALDTADDLNETVYFSVNDITGMIIDLVNDAINKHMNDIDIEDCAYSIADKAINGIEV